jgi:hypothetical protein
VYSDAGGIYENTPSENLFKKTSATTACAKYKKAKKHAI